MVAKQYVSKRFSLDGYVNIVVSQRLTRFKKRKFGNAEAKNGEISTTVLGLCIARHVAKRTGLRYGMTIHESVCKPVNVHVSDWNMFLKKNL